MNKTSKVFIDPKEKLVSHDSLERYNNQLREKTSNTGGKRSPPSEDDDDLNVINMDSDNGQQMTPQGKKKLKMNTDLFFFNKTRNPNHRSMQQVKIPYDSGNGRQDQFNISNQAVTYAVENNLQAIKIECSPALDNREQAKIFVINLLKHINKDFRNECPGGQQPLGFHHWWIDKGGKILYGITNDVDLYIYLCDIKHYPTQIDKFQIKPDPPKRLPPQNTVVIKFVSNEIRKDYIAVDLKNLYTSIFSIDDMMGTMRSNSRHIRVEFYQKNDYAKIINDGKVGLQGQIFEVEEYLAPPKILICSKCNASDHVKKVCESPIEICRRCGQNRNDGGKHDECIIKCHHCGGEHLSTAYKCPTVVRFRQELLIRLKNDRNKLPPNIKLFIPIDCRMNGDRNRFLTSQNENELQKSVPSDPPAINPWAARQFIHKETSEEMKINQTIKQLADELTETKRSFIIEHEKMKNCYEAQSKSIQQCWLMIQQQVQAQNQFLTLMSTMIKDNVTVMNQVIPTLTTLNEIVKIKCVDEIGKNKIDMSRTIINSTLNHMKNLNDSYAKHEHSLTVIMNKQTNVFETALNSLLPTVNE